MQSINLTINIYNNFKPLELTCKLSLTNSPLKIIVDAKYYSELCKIRWSLDRYGYAYSNITIDGSRKTTGIHRHIMFLEGKLINKLEVDHIDRDKLNNVISNLRMVTKQENQRNKIKYGKSSSSKYIGVSWHKRDNRWRAMIKHNWINKYLGSFVDEEVAAHAYDEALRKLPIDEKVKVYNFPR